MPANAPDWDVTSPERVMVMVSFEPASVICASMPRPAEAVVAPVPAMVIAPEPDDATIPVAPVTAPAPPMVIAPEMLPALMPDVAPDTVSSTQFVSCRSWRWS